jgi:DNA-binding ferritin-like protein
MTMTIDLGAHLPALGAHKREEVVEVDERVRGSMDRLGPLDAASQDALIEVVRELEKQLWMVRAQQP